MDHEPGTRSEGWRKEGRCSACAFFAVDFGAAPEFYGHCKIYRRTGSRSATDWACPEFKPLPGFEETIRLKDHSPTSDAAASSAGARPRVSAPKPRSDRPSSVLTPRRGPRDAGARRVVLRRRGDGGAATERDATPIEGGVLAALDPDASNGGDAMDRDTLRDVLFELIQDHIAIEDVELASKWAGGTLTLTPANPELKPYELDLETFFKKIIMVRDRLRVLEQKINGHGGLSASDKVDLQQYISRCYGSLTSFNILFRHGEDRFSSK